MRGVRGTRDAGAELTDPLRYIWEAIDKNGAVCEHRPELGPCWIWTKRLWKSGYGRLGYKGRSRRAHSVVWELLRGEPPEGLVPDHLCRERRCVNPDHIEYVTSRENTMRGAAITALNANKSVCKYGHPFSPDNTFITKGGHRSCIKCNQRRNAEGGRRRREREGKVNA